MTLSITRDFEDSTMNKQFLKNIFTSNSSISSLVLRVPVGIILTAHGAQKLFAWFGG